MKRTEFEDVPNYKKFIDDDGQNWKKFASYSKTARLKCLPAFRNRT